MIAAIMIKITGRAVIDILYLIQKVFRIFCIANACEALLSGDGSEPL